MGVFGDNFQPLLALHCWRFFAVTEKVGVGAQGGASHPSAQLIELRQAKGVGAVHNQRVGVGNVEAAFDDGGGKQNIQFAFAEIMHHLRKLTLVHLPVTHADTRFGDEFLQVHSHGVNGLNAIVDEKNLPAAFHFTQHRLPHNFGRVGADMCDHR